MTSSKARRKPAKFGTNAKTITAALAVAALVGSWNLVGHLDAAQASDSIDNDETAFLDIKLPTPTPSPIPTLKPLVIAPLPTLRPAGALLQVDTRLSCRPIQRPWHWTCHRSPRWPRCQRWRRCRACHLCRHLPLPIAVAVCGSSSGGGGGGGGGSSRSGGS